MRNSQPLLWKLLSVGISGLLTLLFFATQMEALDLKEETLRAWQEHVSGVRASNEQRTMPGHSYLWVAEDEDRLKQLLAGEPQTAPLQGRGSEAVPSGLIHHWIGAVFIPNASLTDVSSVTRDYEHYNEFFRPSVIRSQVLSKSDDKDAFAVQMASKVMFVSAGLDARVHAEHKKVSQHRAYTISFTTEVQEIQNFGKPDERRLEPDHGVGFVWRLFTINRLEERDDGVILEIETMALSRDIPGSVRFVVTPVVRRVSRNAMLISLRQTADAVASRTEMAHNGQKRVEQARDDHKPTTDQALSFKTSFQPKH